MAHVQGQPERLAGAYRRGVRLIARVILAASAVLVVLAPEVIQLLLGPEWHAVTLPLQILSVGMLFRAGCKMSDSLARAIGAVYRRAWRQAIYAAAVVAGACVGQLWGLPGVALALPATLALNFFLLGHPSLLLAGVTWRTFAVAHLPGLALAALVSLPVAAAAEVLRASGSSPVLVLIASAAVGFLALVPAACIPRLFLGQDGRWMARQL